MSWRVVNRAIRLLIILTICLSHSGVTSVTGANLPDPLPDPDGKPADMSKPVKVFILMGQSNMLGFGKITGMSEGSLDFACKNKGKYPYLVDDSGNWTVGKDARNVRVMNFKDHINDWLTPQGSGIGPELGIGHYVAYVLDEPVMILKSCIGNRSLGWDLLPPGSEPYDFDGKTYPGYRGTSDNPKGTGEKPQEGWYAGKQYDDDIASAQQVLSNLSKYYPGAKGYEVEGFFWWQGDKDMRNAAHVSRYEQNLEQLMVALRKEFNSPNAKFVFASLGQTKKGDGSGHGKILDAMESVAKKHKGEAAFVYTNPLSLGGSSSGHYNKHAETYMNVGEAMGKAMAELLMSGKPAKASSSASSSKKSTGGANTSALRKARKMSAANRAKLNDVLLNALVELSDENKLKPTPLRVSFTRAQVALVGAKADGTLTFQAGSGKKADMPWKNLKPADIATIAMLVAQLKSDSDGAQAMAGVHMELLGRTAVADTYYEKAGDASKQLTQFFD